MVRLYARYTRGLRSLVRVASREVQFREAIISQKWPRQRPCLLPRSQAYREPSHGRGNGSIAGSRVTATFVSVLQDASFGWLPVGCSLHRVSPRRYGPRQRPYLLPQAPGYRVQFPETISPPKWPLQRPYCLPKAPSYRGPSQGGGDGSIARPSKKGSV